VAEHVPLVDQAAFQVLSCGRLVVDCDTQACINLESIPFFKEDATFDLEFRVSSVSEILTPVFRCLENLPWLLLHLNFIHFHLLNGPTLQGYCVGLNCPTVF
jgi:hypothetical protein